MVAAGAEDEVDVACHVDEDSVLTPHSLPKAVDEVADVDEAVSEAVALFGRATQDVFLFLTFRFVLSELDRLTGSMTGRCAFLPLRRPCWRAPPPIRAETGCAERAERAMAAKGRRAKVFVGIMVMIDGFG